MSGRSEQLRRPAWTRTVVRLAAVATIGAVWINAPDAAATTDAGASIGHPSSTTPSGPFGRPPPGTYRPPLRAPVTDPFRAPPHPYGSGNRGIEYATSRGQTVSAVGSGLVTFAGAVGGRLAVTVAHPDGRRSSYTWLASTRVSVGDTVPRGAPVGTASTLVHLGVREGDRYVDPAGLFEAVRRRAVLVPRPSTPVDPPSS